jgi:hypothetical protein
VNVEFLDEPVDEWDGSGTDLRHVGDRRRPSWIVGALIGLLTAIALVVVLTQPTPRPRPVSAPPVALTSSPRPALTPTTHPVALDDISSAIYYRAQDTTRTMSVLRDGSDMLSCTAVPLGTVPQHAAGAALVRELRGYRLIDSARVIDQTAGLCSLQIRARGASGTVAVALISSPTPRSHRASNVIRSDVAAIEGTLIEYVQFTTTDGWSIIVGTSGPQGSQPSTGDLGRVAVSSALRW